MNTTHTPDLDALDPAGRRACLTSTVEMWPDPGDTEGEAAAVAVCDACPIRVECRAAAIKIPGLAGVWGGTTEAERADVDQQAASASRAKRRRFTDAHGSIRGYRAHRAANEQPCADCAKFMSRYNTAASIRTGRLDATLVPVDLIAKIALAVDPALRTEMEFGLGTLVVEACVERAELRRSA